jgi:predicted HD superfamily hydrolase involved in NAD metabolism
MQWSEMLQQVQTMMSVKRWTHTLGVVQLAGELAACYGLDVEQAKVAALLHDRARDWSPAQLLKKADDFAIVVTEVDRLQPELLHGPVAAALAPMEFSVSDPDAVEAIRWHTTGKPYMADLAKVIYIADSLEPGRDYPGVTALRTQMKQGLDEAYLAVMDHTLTYLVANRKLIHPISIEARNQLLVTRGERKTINASQ